MYNPIDMMKESAKSPIYQMLDIRFNEPSKAYRNSSSHSKASFDKLILSSMIKNRHYFIGHHHLVI